jgi:hypothetical protein
LSIIYKYKLDFQKPIGLELHSQYEITHAAMQGGEPYLWVKTEPVIGPRRVVEFYIVGTGQEFSSKDNVLVTFFDGDLTWHLVQARKPLQAEVINRNEGTLGLEDDIPIDPLEALKKK